MDRTSQLPWGRLIAVSDWATAYRYLAIIGAFSLLGAVLVWPIFGPDYPPGVDTATFLHLSWVTKLAASGQLANPLVDPYWYGGFQYLVSYPPLGYGLVGIISFLTRLDLVWVYTALLVISYGAVAAATYWLATELGLRRWSAALVALAYPVLSAVFLWGWFTSVLALPLGLASIMLLERSLRTGNWRPALWGAICMALSILVHHMTGLALGLGLIAWFVYHLIAGIYSRRQVVAFSALFVAITALLVAPWGIPFMVHALDVGFRREVPGLWAPDVATYSTNIVDSSLIGAHIYPSYLGITLMLLAIGGTVYALLERQRLAGLAIMLLVLVWFSMGADANPLIRVYPFSGLDTARFHLYMVPLMALLGGALVERMASFGRDLWPRLPRRPWYGLSVAVLLAILAFPVLDAWRARDHMAPYQVAVPTQQALKWLGEHRPAEDGVQAPIYSVGLWTWHSFLIPYMADRRLVDGWHDERASNVRLIRELRMMGWTGNVDIDRAHDLLAELGAEYVLVKRVSEYSGEHSELFWEEIEAHPEWFEKREQWGGGSWPSSGYFRNTPHGSRTHRQPPTCHNPLRGNEGRPCYYRARRLD